MAFVNPRPPVRSIHPRVGKNQVTVITPHSISGGRYNPVTLMVTGDAEMAQVSGSGGLQVIERPRQVAAIQWFDRSPYELTLNFVMDATLTSPTPISDMNQMWSWLEAPSTSGSIIQPPYLTISGPTPGTGLQWQLSTLKEKSRLYTPAGGELQVMGTAVLYEYNPPYPYTGTSPAQNQQKTSTTKTNKPYTIKSGDTILKIAASQMGKASTTNALAILNMNKAILGNVKITVNLLSFAGTIIRIPSA